MSVLPKRAQSRTNRAATVMERTTAKVFQHPLKSCCALILAIIAFAALFSGAVTPHAYDQQLRAHPTHHHPAPSSWEPTN